MIKRFVHIAGLLGVFTLTSCKSLSKLTSRDNSTAKTTTAKNQTPQQRDFLNQIEVTPGAAVTSRHKTSTTQSANNTGITNTVAGTGGNGRGSSELGAFNIERAGYLQLKYAVMTDATVEKMTNIPLLETIDRWWGTKYCYGGSTESCIDCSAFTQIVMRDAYNTTLPRTSQEQFDNTQRIELSELQEGDLVFFHTTGRKKDITHVGVYLHNNKFVHAATSGGVMISDLNEKYWQPRYRGAGRVR
jgi:lipoprotein Spr